RSKSGKGLKEPAHRHRPLVRPGRSRLVACRLGLLAKRVMSGLALLPRCERRGGEAAALLLLVVLGLRLLLFLVASHLTLRHGVLPVGCSVIESRYSSSTALDHAMVAELFHNPRLEGGGDGGVHGTHVPALVAGHGGARRQQGRTREAVIGALRALADGAE